MATWTDWLPVGNVEGEVIWTNPTPSASKGSEVIYGDYSSYVAMLFVFNYDTSDSTKYYSYIPKGTSFASYFREPRVCNFTDTYISIGSCKINGTTYDSRVIPVKIVGFKKDITDV